VGCKFGSEFFVGIGIIEKKSPRDDKRVFVVIIIYVYLKLFFLITKYSIQFTLENIVYRFFRSPERTRTSPVRAHHISDG